MPSTIKFSLRNNQARDVLVTVSDRRTGALALDSYPLTQEEKVLVEISSDSFGEGKAEWFFWSPDGLVNSRKLNDNIRDGDNNTLGFTTGHFFAPRFRYERQPGLTSPH